MFSPSDSTTVGCRVVTFRTLDDEDVRDVALAGGGTPVDVALPGFGGTEEAFSLAFSGSRDLDFFTGFLG